MCWRLSARWRQENYFKYAREHVALDALDSYADTADDPTRMVTNPAKRRAHRAVDNARAQLRTAQGGLTEAIDQAVTQARQPGTGGRATVDPAASTALSAAQNTLTRAQQARRNVPEHLPLGQVRPGARLMQEERKLITHAIRMAAYNAESDLARTLRPYYARSGHEGRALLREAMTLPGDIEIIDNTIHVRLNPASAPRRTRALAALCAELTATGTRYPGTDLTMIYSMKPLPTHPSSIPSCQEFWTRGATRHRASIGLAMLGSQRHPAPEPAAPSNWTLQGRGVPPPATRARLGAPAWPRFGPALTVPTSPAVSKIAGP